MVGEGLGGFPKVCPDYFQQTPLTSRSFGSIIASHLKDDSLPTPADFKKLGYEKLSPKFGKIKGMEKEKVLQFLKLERFCVLATADKSSKPEAAMVCFFVKDDLSIFLYTDSRSRKTKNLGENSQASLVISNLEKGIEIQTDGKTTILKGDEAQKAKEYILSVDPEQKSHMEKRPVFFILFKPDWIRYCDFGVEPDEIFEFKP